MTCLLFYTSQVTDRCCFSRETEVIPVQKVWSVLRDFLALRVLLVPRVVLEGEETL